MTAPKAGQIKMRLNSLIKTTQRKNKIVGRGLGSGKGKTAGRGTKGQKARGKISLGFIGGTLPLYKRLPYNRGQRNMKSRSNALAVDISKLQVFKVGSEVNLQTLIDKKIIENSTALKRGVKIVGSGVVPEKLIVKLLTSKEAKSSIEKTGGKVDNG